MPTTDPFAADVAAGLAATPKTLPPKWLYDDVGSALFERICALPEYYLTRAEAEILAANAGALAEAFGARATVIELGSGTAAKTRLVLPGVAARGGRYVAVDVSASALEAARETLARDVPSLPVTTLRADYLAGELAPLLGPRDGPRALLFMGSNIGNYTPAEQRALLSRLAPLLSSGDAFVLGADLAKSPARLVAAYDDADGVTAAFDLNLFARIDRELGGEFAAARFAHRARWNAHESRMEMHLESLAAQRVRVAALGRSFDFARGETIHTESSYKFTPAALEALARHAGLAPERTFTDAAGDFAVAVWRAP